MTAHIDTYAEYLEIRRRKCYVNPGLSVYFSVFQLPGALAKYDIHSDFGPNWTNVAM